MAYILNMYEPNRPLLDRNLEYLFFDSLLAISFWLPKSCLGYFFSYGLLDNYLVYLTTLWLTPLFGLPGNTHLIPELNACGALNKFPTCNAITSNLHVSHICTHLSPTLFLSLGVVVGPWKSTCVETLWAWDDVALTL